MIYTTLLLSLAAIGIWFNPVYENFIAPRKKRVELGEAKFYGDLKTEEEIAKNNPVYKTEWKYDPEGEIPFGNPKDGLVFYKEEEGNFFARKLFNCLLCFGFWFAFLFFAIHSLFFAYAITVAFVIERLAACFAVSFLTVNIHKIVKLIPTKI